MSVGRDKNRDKPLAPDAKCLLRAMDAVSGCKSLEQARVFSAGYIIPLSGLHPAQGDKQKNKPCPLRQETLPP